MNLQGARVLLTGATGGIGGALAGGLTREGARLVLVGRDRDALAHRSAQYGAEALVFDLAAERGHEELVRGALQRLGGIDVLVNAAGVSDFGPFEQATPATVERLITVNLIAPMLLTAAVLPHLARGARIVNIGSVFGGIGFPYFSAYSASKFGLRGFSEALRREVAERGIGVTYVAPRATRTGMNSAAVHRYGELSGMKFDEPDAVAAEILQAVARDAAEHTIGGAERLYLRLNALLPRLFDRMLRPQARAARVALKSAIVPPAK